MGLAHGTICRADVAVPEMAAGAAYYKGLFCWEVEAGGSDSMPYSMFTKGGQAVAGMGSITAEQIKGGQPPAWSSYIIVDDADVTFA
jgi:predicted enzyme related to lactoylglutathione lyase